VRPCTQTGYQASLNIRQVSHGGIVACRLWYHHWPNEDRVHSTMYQIWQRTARFVDPFTWSEAMSCIDSARCFVGPKIEAQLAWLNPRKPFGGSTKRQSRWSQTL
jgi:hypothetical protein